MALYVYNILCVCLWGDYFHEQRVKLRIANVGNGRQARKYDVIQAAETGKVTWVNCTELLN